MSVKVWIGLYHHKHGVSAYDFWQDESPTEEQVLDAIYENGDEFEPEKDEWTEIIGPFEKPEGV